MLNKVSINVSDFYSLRGRIGRLDFLLGIILTGSLTTALYFLLRNYVLGLDESVYYFGFKTFLQFFALSLATPFYVKRFHDLNSSGYWVLVYWVCLPFTFEMAYFIELTIGIQVNPFIEIILLAEVIGLLILLVLLLKRGNPEENEWGDPKNV